MIAKRTSRSSSARSVASGSGPRGRSVRGPSASSASGTICPTCGTVLLNRNKKCCSTRCARIFVGRLLSGSRHPGWKGGAWERRKEGRKVAERVLGHELSPSAIVHHVNGNNRDNRPANLVILQSIADHMELHRRMRVRDAGGNPWKDRVCKDCGPRPVEAFRPSYIKANGVRGYSRCVECARSNARRRYRDGTRDDV